MKDTAKKDHASVYTASPVKIMTSPLIPVKQTREEKEKRDFRVRMKEELKNIAKESFREEMERLRSNKHLLPSNNEFRNEADRQQYLESEIERLQTIVDDIRKQQSQLASGNNSYFAPMKLEWSSAIVRDQLPNPNFPSLHFSAPPTSHYRQNTNNEPPPSTQLKAPRNQHFVLSSAPIQGAVKHEVSLFRDTMVFAKSMPGTSHHQHPNSQTIDQATRFAEMQSLFQMPSIFPSLLSEFASYGEEEYGNGSEEKYRERQRRLQEQAERQERLEKTISTHRERLDKGRHPVRRFPITVPAKRNRPTIAGQSPRLKIHQQRSISAQTGENLQVSSAPSGGSSNNNNQSDSISLNQSPTRLAKTAPSVVMSVTSANGLEASRTSSPLNSSAPPPSEGVPESKSGEETKPTTALPATMTAEEFQKKADQMKEDLKQLVREAVHQELLTEGKALRYTRRFQSHYISTQQPPLVRRIEKTVEDKIKSLQIELAALRTTRLNKNQGRRKSNVDDDNEEESGAPGWFFRNEDNGDAEIDMKALMTEINRSVQTVLKRHLGEGGGRSGSHDPNATVVHGHIGADTYVDDKEVGFESLADPIPSYLKPSLPETTTAASLNKPAGNAAASIIDDPPPKPKSKADRLLGISTDPKSGLQFNDPPAVSHKPGLFGSIGSLFSAKPSTGGDSSSVMSSLASNRFGASNRSSMTNHFGHPSSNSSHTQPAPFPTAPSNAKLTDIVEESEDSSNKEKPASKLLKPGPSRSQRKSSVMSKDKDGDNASVTGGTVNPSVKSEDPTATTAPNAGINPSLAAEIGVEEANYRTLMSNLLNLADLKGNVKKELKDWERNFEMRNGRPPTNDDKAPMSERYIAYKMICGQVQEAKDLVTASEDKLKELKEKAGLS